MTMCQSMIPHKNESNDMNQSQEMQNMARQNLTTNKYKRLMNKLVMRYKNDYLTTAAEADHLGKLGGQIKEDVKHLLDKASQDQKQFERGVKMQLDSVTKELEDVKQQLDKLIDLFSKST